LHARAHGFWSGGVLVVASQGRKPRSQKLTEGIEDIFNYDAMDFNDMVVLFLERAIKVWDEKIKKEAQSMER
jgi:hypothetical protein